LAFFDQIEDSMQHAVVAAAEFERDAEFSAMGSVPCQVPTMVWAGRTADKRSIRPVAHRGDFVMAIRLSVTQSCFYGLP